VDKDSHTSILVYDDTQWVSYMDDKVKAERTEKYHALAMLGTADWATDLKQYNPAPARSGGWTPYISKVSAGQDPIDSGAHVGGWTNIECSDPHATKYIDYTPDERWTALGCNDAFNDAVKTWETVDYPNPNHDFEFTGSIVNTLNGPPGLDCASMGEFCNSMFQCSQFKAGAAGYEIMNSFAQINMVRITSLLACICITLGLAPLRQSLPF
jgi:hypothetical protein